DLRESPSVDIAVHIANSHPGTVLAVEPNIEQLPARLEGITTLSDVEHALSSADVVVLLVDHSVFKQIPGARLSSLKVIDTRGVWASKA
ncbi:UDP-N-acetyl-D-mannosamine dehydrogenase, partial [Pseudomonas tolaasii]